MYVRFTESPVVGGLAVNRKMPGSSPTHSSGLFLFQMHSALSQSRFSYVSFEWGVKPLVLGTPLNISLIVQLGSSSLSG